MTDTTPPSASGSPPTTRTTAAAHLLGGGVLLAVLAALPVAPTDLDRHQFPKETVLHLSVFLAALMVGRSGARGLPRWPAMWLALLLGGTLLGLLVATNPWLTLRAAGLTATGVLAFILAQSVARAGRVGTLLGWTGLAALVGVGSALAQAWGVEHASFAELRAPGGTLGNRNFIAHLAALALPLAMAGVLAGRRRLVVGASSTLMVVVIIGLVLTRSRAGWLAAGAAAATVALVLLLAGGAAPPRHRVVRLPLLALAGIVLAIALPNTLEWRSDSPYRDTLGNLTNYREGSGRGRLLQYQNSLELALAHPFLGVGAGNWPLRYGEVAPRSDPSWARNDVIPLNPWPSSDWIALISERGVLAPVIAALFGMTLAWRGFRRRRDDPLTAVAMAALLGTLAAVAVAGLFDAVMLLAVPVGWTAVTAGAFLAVPLRDPDPGPFPRASWRLLLLVVTVAAVRSVQQTGAYLVAGDGESRAAVARAVRIDPFNYALQIELGARGPCRTARAHAEAALALAPTWPAAQRAVRRCR